MHVQTVSGWPIIFHVNAQQRNFLVFSCAVYTALFPAKAMSEIQPNFCYTWVAVFVTVVVFKLKLRSDANVDIDLNQYA